jgi:hypothetical protein
VTEPTYEQQLAAVIAAAKKKLGWGLVKLVTKNIAWGVVIAAGVVWWKNWPAVVLPFLALTTTTTSLSISLIISVWRSDRRNAEATLTAGLPIQVTKKEFAIPPAKPEPAPGLSVVRD